MASDKQSMKRNFAAVAALLVISPLSACGANDDPDRFDALYDEVISTLETADWESDPDDRDDLETAFGWDGDSEFAVAEFEPNPDGTPEAPQV